LKALIDDLTKAAEGGYAGFKDKAHGWGHNLFSDSTEKQLWDLMGAPAEGAYIAKLAEIKAIIDEANIAEGSRKKTLLDSKKTEQPDCSKLPKGAITTANKATFIQKAKAGWDTFKKALDCLKSQASVAYLLAKITEIVIDYLIEIFAGVLGLAVKAMKIIYYSVKASYYVFKALELKDKTEEEKINERSGFWGKAVGCAIRIVLILLHVPDAKRKMRKIK